jgi:dolichol kinase
LVFWLLLLAHLGDVLFDGEAVANVLLMLGCYAYILFIILLSERMSMFLHISQKSSRKFLHAMIGNLPFIIPFFTASIYPALVAAPFIFVTFLASPASPFRGIKRKMKGLAGITEEGHHLGLVFYAISYTVSAFFFASKPYIIAAGILPMAYGDAVASLIGEKYGKRKYKLAAPKSFEGSIVMFLVSFAVFTASLIFFSMFYPFSVLGLLLPSFSVAVVTTLVEGISPLGFDNLTVPAFGVLAFILLGGGS